MTTRANDEIPDELLDQLCEEVHVLINRHNLPIPERLALHCAAIADVIATIECPGCRRIAIKRVTKTILPRFLADVAPTPASGHLH